MNMEKSKGPSDFVARYFNRPIENRLVKLLLPTRVTPNEITILTNVLAYVITGLFLFGVLLLAAVLTFVVGVVDGVDGKLARARGATTKLGKMEHAFDLLYEFSWLAALGIFLTNASGNAQPLILSMASIILISFYKLSYEIFVRTASVSLDIYGRFELLFRRVAGRRNIFNIYILACVIFGVPALALVIIAIHALVTAIIYAWRASFHLHQLDNQEIQPDTSV